MPSQTASPRFDDPPNLLAEHVRETDAEPPGELAGVDAFPQPQPKMTVSSIAVRRLTASDHWTGGFPSATRRA